MKVVNRMPTPEEEAKMRAIMREVEDKMVPMLLEAIQPQDRNHPRADFTMRANAVLHGLADVAAKTICAAALSDLPATISYTQFFIDRVREQSAEFAVRTEGLFGRIRDAIPRALETGDLAELSKLTRASVGEVADVIAREREATDAKKKV